MVQPVPRTSTGGRPDGVAALPPNKLITTGKYDDFRSYLSRRGLAESGSGLAAQGAQTRVPEGVPPEREMSVVAPEPDASRSLAPEEQPSLCRVGCEPAEWFSLINPLGGAESAPVAPQVASAHAGAAEVAALLERWVRRAAVGGDSRRGAVRLELGHGQFAGAELLVVAEPGQVSVELQLPSSLRDAEVGERLRGRLERRGLRAEVVVR